MPCTKLAAASPHPPSRTRAFSARFSRPIHRAIDSRRTGGEAEMQRPPTGSEMEFNRGRYGVEKGALGRRFFATNSSTPSRNSFLHQRFPSTRQNRSIPTFLFPSRPSCRKVPPFTRVGVCLRRKQSQPNPPSREKNPLALQNRHFRPQIPLFFLTERSHRAHEASSPQFSPPIPAAQSAQHPPLRFRHSNFVLLISTRRRR